MSCRPIVLTRYWWSLDDTWRHQSAYWTFASLLTRTWREQSSSSCEKGDVIAIISAVPRLDATVAKTWYRWDVIWYMVPFVRSIHVQRPQPGRLGPHALPWKSPFVEKLDNCHQVGQGILPYDSGLWKHPIVQRLQHFDDYMAFQFVEILRRFQVQTKSLVPHDSDAISILSSLPVAQMSNGTTGVQEIAEVWSLIFIKKQREKPSIPAQVCSVQVKRVRRVDSHWSCKMYTI